MECILQLFDLFCTVSSDKIKKLQVEGIHKLFDLFCTVSLDKIKTFSKLYTLVV